MQMWGLTIDSVTIINLVLAIGLSVDYSAHVAHAFVIAKGTRQERADHALGEMGTAVIHGAMSTFVAVLILSVSQSYIFRVFFQQFFGICIFGAAHGLVFLPVLLSLVGPEQIALEESLDAPTASTSRVGTKGGPQLTSPATIEIHPTPAVSTISSAPPSAPASPPGSAKPRCAVLAWDAAARIAPEP